MAVAEFMTRLAKVVKKLWGKSQKKEASYKDNSLQKVLNSKFFFTNDFNHFFELPLPTDLP